MSSFRRIISSRANAALSTGPRTQAGKRRSSQNALRHGCRSRRNVVILENESRREFDTLLQSYRSAFHPRNPTESACVHRMAAATWRSRRLSALETRMLNEALASRPDRDPLLTLLSLPAFTALWRYQTTEHLNFCRALHSLLQIRRRQAVRLQNLSTRQTPGLQQDEPLTRPLRTSPGPPLQICANEATL